MAGTLCAGMIPATQAADIKPHAARYRIEQAVSAGKEIRVPGSLTTELTQTCSGFVSTWSMNYTVDRGKQAPGSGEQFEEVLAATESADGSTLDYTMRYRVGSRTTIAEGQARFGKGEEPGTLSVKPAALAPDSRIQPKTLPPVASRAKYIDALVAGEKGPWIGQGMELLRFHRSNDYKLEVIPMSGFPAAQPLPRGTKAVEPIDPNSLLKARSAILKQTSYQIAEWGDAFSVLHTNGIMGRMAFRRAGVEVVAILLEVTGFPPPKCN